MKIFTIPMSEDQESDAIDGQLYNLPWGFTVGENDYLNTNSKSEVSKENTTHILLILEITTMFLL